MNFQLIALIVCSVLLSSFAQIVLKAGMGSPAIHTVMQSGSMMQIFAVIVVNLKVLFGLSLYFLSAAVWLLVLAKVDVSLAYPFVGLGFVITMLLAYFINGEALTVAKVLGTVLITCGVIVIARG